MKPARLSTLLLLLALAVPLQAGYLERPEARSLIEELVQQGLDRASVEQALARAERKQSILDAIARPAESRPWYQYRPIFLTDARIDGGVRFWNRHAAVVERAAREFAVDPAIIVAIIGVETFYGRHTGNYRVLDALATLGFDYPKRAGFFRRELGQFLILAHEEGWPAERPKGSYAGAMGLGQFIPSSYRAYAVDFDGDGKRDLWNAADAIGSVANYFHRHGWRQGETVAVPAIVRGAVRTELVRGVKPAYSLRQLATEGVRPRRLPRGDGPFALIELEGKTGPEFWIGLHNFYVITRYNRSPLYAMAVLQLSQAIRERRQARQQAETGGGAG
ncbi:MAG: lytic murein transglycosylase B [Gammaproteobacteria bacterium]|nr:MAG: lytic murein transglycosylase B [Gammaproteobacteria bacterium]